MDERDGGQQPPGQEGKQRPQEGAEPRAPSRCHRLNPVTPAHALLQGTSIGSPEYRANPSPRIAAAGQTERSLNDGVKPPGR
jgi:hypothetical protein